jgi:hypothetical protein
MLKIVRQGMFCAAFAAALGSLPKLNAQKTPATPSAPVPAQIGAARKVFISNAGVDGTSRLDLERIAGPDEPYNQLYAAMKSWGRYELVAAPADADLVFELRFAAPLTDCGDKMAANYARQLDLAILDARTRFRLWTITQPVEGAKLKGNWEKNFNAGMANLADDIKKLAVPAAADPAAR